MGFSEVPKGASEERMGRGGAQGEGLWGDVGSGLPYDSGTWEPQVGVGLAE